jgi:hypothetical protein
LNHDYPKVVECFHGLVEESFPSAGDEIGTQLLYFMEDTVDTKVLSAFTKKLSAQLKQKQEIWLVLDSGANQHVIKDLSIMKNKTQTLAKVVGVSGGTSNLDCTGDVSLHLVDQEGSAHSLELNGAMG